jgi:two-component system sensor histidine kinase ChiS
MKPNMLSMIRHVLLVVFTIGLVSKAESSDDRNKFRRLSVVDGLSQNSAFEILQDRDGFIWIGTQDGLNRYDGYEFKVFKHDPDDENSLSENMITSLHQDSRGMLWIGTQKGGLNRLDPVAGSFEHFLHDEEEPRSFPGDMVMSISEVAGGQMWFGTHSGLSRFREETNDFDHYTHDPERRGSIGANFVTSILHDSRGAMWVGTWEGGLNRYTPSEGEFEVFNYDPLNQAGIPDSRITALYEDRAGEVWVGTLGGLSRYDVETGTFETFRHDPQNPNSLGSNQISSILEDGSGGMWVGMRDEGLDYWDSSKQHITHYKNDPDNPESLSENRVISLLEDRSGVIWAGTNLGGINQVDRHRIRFQHLAHDPENENSLSGNTIWAIHEGRSGAVWIGTNSRGLVRYDPSTETVTRIPEQSHGSSGKAGGHVRAIHEDSDGRVWLATQKGLQVFTPGEGVVEHFEYKDEDPSSPSSPYITTILEDSRGQLWFGGVNGFDRYDEWTRTFKPFFQGEWAEQEEAESSVLVLYEDSNGDIWGGTRGGLIHYEVETDRFTRYAHDPDDQTSISHNLVYAIHEDERGAIWTGTFGGGLNRLDVETGHFQRWTEQNSLLPTNTVFGVLGDDAGFLWLSTHRGLTRFEPESETFRVYGRHHGVQSPEFNSGAFHRGSITGDLYFGGINGVNIVRPGVMRDNPNPPEVVLTDLRLESQSIDAIAMEKPLGAIDTDHPVHLAHDQNDLWINYVGIHYSLPAANQYAYMLENYDQRWRYVGGSRGASYTNLDPGTYRFRVKAASVDGVWSDESASVEIRIDPPWWQTTLAYVSYLAMFVIGVFFVDTVQRRRVVRQERERGAIREARLRALALEVQNERQTRELEEARDLQLSMLPHDVPEHPSVEIQAYMKTATEVGGDYYDFHVTDDGTLTVAIGDATDHGARAGTMVTAVKGLFNILVEEHDLEQVIKRSTRALKRMHLGSLYMALALVKIRDDSMCLAGAGMPAALIHRNASNLVEEVSLSGMPLGSLVDYPYTVSEIRLHPADTILLMSDGFAERFSPGREMFGYERAKKEFSEVANRTPAEIIDHLVEISDKWAGNDSPTDDMTFVVMKTKHDIHSGSSDGSV